ncbi:MAG: bifunctional diaminohydroxyphosphoribosylaminopyrimidine deaminase/5-amino-6-(5-phosphoribosylamino)uracil reductase RibD [Myxococcales bacterium]|nr:bifunctional diaminohydroxyphosphoribosylaminopyrimidine deaminase/5-amino-6-(5-phosphoribosylamino)uracil reductase RibD [Myxococcales bacterium]
MSPRDAAWMRMAIAAAHRGGPSVRPNPQVGCVLVADGVVVGEGYHARCGGPHAEAEALAAAGNAARGATAYVTLEPCNHHGRTPPCAQALIAAGVRRVVIGVADPNPTASGGCATLRQAGVEVVTGVESTACEQAAEIFFVGQRHKRAFVQLKLAATLDGFTAAADGTSQWITSPAARIEVHRMRAHADAVLIGSGTALADNPRLDVRHLQSDRQPIRVVTDRRLRLPPDSRLADTSALRTLVLIDDPLVGVSPRAEALRARGVEVQCVAPVPGSDWLAAVLAHLHDLGMMAVLVEGGATLAGSLLQAQLVDRLDVFFAPRLLGSGTSLWHELGITTLSDARRLVFDPPKQIGPDIWLTGRPTISEELH